MSGIRKPIAICGVALRLPGGVNSTEKLWEALRDGCDMRGPVPKTRYNREGFSDALGGKCAIKTQYGYFLDQDPGQFDTSLFSLTEEEARRTDPQQRLLLEIAYECFENAGLVNYRGSDIGTYVGTFGEDWLYSQAKEDQHSGGYILGGQADLMLANRVSYEYDLRGPSMVIKTGCSASLVGLHEACRALQLGDCSGALVAGSNLILGPTLTAAMTSEGILSPEGSCKSFSGEADGFARGEAVVAIYIQTLDRAIQERLPVRAIITNSSINSNGTSASILQPNMRAQIDLMRKVYTDIGCNPDRTAYVECHGTGTPTGDPIEVAAVGEVFGKHGVFIGSLKPNFGHSEGSSGLSSLLKSIVMLEKSTIVPNIKFKTPNPKIDFQKHKLQVPRRVIPWPRNRDFRISINSFGIGGSNAHVLVEHPFMHFSNYETVPRPRLKTQLLLLSAATSSALKDRVLDIGEHMKRHPNDLSDLTYTLARHREFWQSRTFAICQDVYDYKPSPISRVGHKVPGIIMVFSGQGAQWPQMGLDLIESMPSFKKSIKAMDDVLKSLVDPPQWSIKSQLQRSSETSLINHAEISQPLCTALQIALVDMFTSAGIKPNAVVGHSSGEIAAAYASGAISREESIIVAYYRGLLFKNFGRKGGMAAIGLDATRTRHFLKPGVSIACENSPSSATITGDEQTILDIIESLRAENDAIMARKLNVDVAYHSPHLRDLEPIYLRFLKEELRSRNISRSNPLVPIYSSVKIDNKVLTVGDFTPEYWVTNLLSTVRFNTAMTQALRAHSQDMLVEIGPHSTLSGPLRQICAHMNIPFKYCSSLHRHNSGTHGVLTALGTLFQHGVKIDLENIIPDGTVLTNLPKYPWNHSASYWYESRLSKSWRARQFAHHELLGLRVTSTTDMHPIWRAMIDVDSVPWLIDHKVDGDVVFPFAGYASMAGEAFRQVYGAVDGFSIRRMLVVVAMVIDVEEPVEVVTSLHRCETLRDSPSEQAFDFSISSYTNSTWIEHCKGIVCLPSSPEGLPQSTDDLHRKVARKAWYGALARLGLQYGPAFRRVRELSTSAQATVAHGHISSTPDALVEAYAIHPTIIDASLQVGVAAFTKGLVRNFARPQVPTYVEKLVINRTTAPMQCVATYTRHNEEMVIHGTEATGKSCLRLEGLRLTELASVDQTSDEADRYGGARLHWVPDTRFQEPSSLVKIPTTSVHDRQVIEELALLCIVDSVPLVKDLGPGKSHLSKHRAWLDWVAEEALSGQHPVLKDTIHVGDLSAEERKRRIHEIYMDASASSTMASFAEGIFRVYSNIQDLFTGRIDVLELLLHENTLAQIYDTVSFDYGRLVKAYSDQRPNLRILEVGAGTGGSTELILRGMQPIGQYSRYSRYTFTDISAGFFSAARERFATAPNMDFMVFDISHDPLEQGFVPDSYDLIIAANVVHATSSLSQTLHHLQLLLAPGGRLLLTEFCTSFRAPNFIYGNFSGWWLGEGDDREWEPYVSVARWDKELKSVGLSGATGVILDSAEPWHYCATIISQKSEAANSPLMEVSILCKDHDALLTQRIVQGLEEEGYIPTIVTFGQELPANQDIVVSLDLETRFFRDLREQDLRHFQVLCRQLKKQDLLWLMPPFQVDCLDPHGSQSLGMIRTVRSELDLSITTLEIDPDATNLVPHMLRLLRETRKATSNQGLFPDHEYVVHDNQIQISRYHPFSLEQELGQEPALNFDGNATYLLTGGLGGLGRLISVWLVEHGARQLVFLSPNAGKKPQDKPLFAELESMGCEVVAVQGVAQSETDISRAIAAAASPVRGVIHLSMQLHDGPILEMTRENWNAVVSPKVDGAWNLHRQLPDLDFFVMTSSLGTVFQQPGQSNYNAANTFLESFCRYRHSLGLPASVLNICPIEDVGYVAENSEARQKLRSQGHWFLDEAAFLKFLELGIRHSNRSQRVSGENHDVESGVNDSQIIMGLKSETPLDDPSNHATWRFDRRMGLYHNIMPEANSQRAAARDDIRTFVARASENPSLLNETFSKEYLASVIGKKIFSFIMKAEEELDVSLSLAEVRLDSLMAIELRRWYKQVFGVDISVLEVLSSGTIAGLGEVAAKALQRKFREGER